MNLHSQRISNNRLLSFILLSLALLALPATNGHTTENDLKDHISKKLKANPLIEGNFTQEKILSGFPRSITSTGSFFYWKNHGLYWEVLQPFPHGTTFTPKKVLHWKNGTSVNKGHTDATEKHISQILLAIFNGDLAGLESFFNIQWQSNDGSWRIDLVPANNVVRKTLSAISLLGYDYIETLDIKNTNGDRTLIHFTDVSVVDVPPLEKCRYFQIDMAVRNQSSPCDP